MKKIRVTALALCCLSGSAFAADKTPAPPNDFSRGDAALAGKGKADDLSFTKDEAFAIYQLGGVDQQLHALQASRDELAKTPAAVSALQKLKAQGAAK